MAATAVAELISGAVLLVYLLSWRLPRFGCLVRRDGVSLRERVF